MARSGWGFGPAHPMEQGIGQVLTAYAARGGQLLGACRWPDNPLTLTHVRWQAADGDTLEAMRRPEDDEMLPPEERAVWVQLALDCARPETAITAAAQAPWVPLTTAPARAAELVRVLTAGRNSRATSGPPAYSAPNSASAPYVPPPGSGPMSGAPYLGGELAGHSPTDYTSEQNGFSSYGYGGAAGSSQKSSVPRVPAGSPPPPVGTSGSHAPVSPSFGAATGGENDPGAWSAGWQRQPVDAPGVSVVPCVEIEMPAVLIGPGSAAHTREFARDVALNFHRACRAIPQVREVRGWMRGGHLVLAARMVVAVGVRPPSRAEMEGAAHILADALAQQTLPYSRLSFAEPGEWAQGSPLPE